MDSLTQALLGAGVQGAVLGSHQGRRALVYGALLGTLPDLDVVMSYADPVSSMTNHRGFSHSLLFLTGLAVLLTALIRWRWPHARYSPLRLFMALWLALITHPLLDAFTSYGTQLWWPWEPIPATWSSIFIIDPVFTVPLLVAVVVGAAQNLSARAVRGLSMALGFCALYLGFTLGAQQVVEQRVRLALANQGVAVQSVFSAPMPFNTLLWRVVARDGDDYVEAVSGLFDRRAPEMIRLSSGSDLAPALAQSPEHQRLKWFTGGWLQYEAVGDEIVVTDLRMGMVGHYTFRFVMARRDGENWVPVVPSRWPWLRGGWDKLVLMLKRIVRPSQPLPLSDWARQPNAAQSPQSIDAPR